MCDFEKALRNAFILVVLDADVASCLFHFKQATKRNFMKNGRLVQFCRENNTAKKLYYKLMMLPLLPAKHIRSCFDTLKNQALSMTELYRRFLAYYKLQWIRGLNVIYNLTFDIYSVEKFRYHVYQSAFCRQEKPETISVYKLPNRTNNSLEAFNGVLGKKLQKHGHFFKFVATLLYTSLTHALLRKNE